MKVKVVSDLHVEFNRGQSSYKFLEGYTYLVAGDVAPISTSIEYLRSVPDSCTVYYIAGNHEFYNHSFPSGYDDLRDAFKDSPNIHFLQNDEVEISDGVFLFGATLWTNLQSDQFTVPYLEKHNCLYDFRVIFADDEVPLQLFTTEIMRNAFSESFDKLSDFLERHKDDTTIVMTHHTPSGNSIAPKYGDWSDPMNYYFSSNLDNFILEKKPNYWVHGHTHDSFDYHLGETRVMCYPHGYPHERQTKYVEGEIEL